MCTTEGFVNVSRQKIRGRNRITYDPSSLDVIACYVIDSQKIVYVKMSDFGEKKSISLRYSPPKNNQSKGILLLEDFTFDRAFLTVV